MIAGKLDSYGKIGWLTLAVTTLWLAWPIGFIVVAYLAGSGRLQAWADEFRGSRDWSRFGSTGFAGFKWPGARSSSGNRAFDLYREEKLNELEEEQREFKAYLERLRQARDKSEFDAFMAERRGRSNVAKVD